MQFISKWLNSPELDRLKEKNKELTHEVKNLNMQLAQVLSELQESHSIYHYQVSDLETKVKELTAELEEVHSTDTIKFSELYAEIDSLAAKLTQQSKLQAKQKSVRPRSRKSLGEA